MKKSSFSANLLFFVTILFWFSLYAYTSYVSPELEQMGAAASFIGLVGSAYGFTQLILRIPVGILSDKWQKKFFICLGGFTSGLAALVMLIFYDYPMAFLFGRALSGVAASSWVTFTVLYSSYFPPDESTKSITMINVANQIGRMLSFVFAGVIVAYFNDPRTAFTVSAIGGFAAFALSLIIKEEGKISGKKPVRIPELLAVAKDHNLLITSILAVCVQVVAFSTYFLFSANHAKSIGASQAELSYLNVVLFLASLIVNFIMSKWLLQRVSSKLLVFIGFLIVSVYCILMPHSTTVLHLYCLQVLAGIGNALTLTLLLGLCVRDIQPDRRSAAMGFFQAVYGLGMTIGPIIMGFVIGIWNLAVGFYVMGTIALVSAIATIILFAKSPEKI